MSEASKHTSLLDSAKTLFHEYGYHATSLADIADHANVPVGNVYYYFKTKEELGIEVANSHLNDLKAVLETITTKKDNPKDRLLSAVKYFQEDKERYTKYGCPIGSIVEELSTANDNVGKSSVTVFTEFITWAKDQWKLLGVKETLAKQHAITLMANIQGAILMAKALQRSDIITYELSRIETWVNSVAKKKFRF